MAREIIERLQTFDPDEEVYIALDKKETDTFTVARSLDVGYIQDDETRRPLLTIRAEV